MNTGIINLVPIKGSFFKRPSIIRNGSYEGELDTNVHQMLQELNGLLNAKAFTAEEQIIMLKDPGIKINLPEQKQEKLKEPAPAPAPMDNASFLYLPLKSKNSKRAGAAAWPDKSLANELYQLQKNPQQGLISLSDLIDKTPTLSTLKYDLAEKVNGMWSSLPFNTKVILSYLNIADYLLAYGYYVRGIKDVNGMYNFVTGHTEGSRNVVKYTVLSAARKRLNDEKINIDHNDESDLIIQDIIKANLPLTRAGFQTSLDKVVNNYINNGKWLELIKNSDFAGIPADMVPDVVKRLKAYPVEPTADNINYILPTIISQMSQFGFDNSDGAEEQEIDNNDSLFDAGFFLDDSATAMISKASIEYAAQLYSCMVLGEELDIFNLANFFTHKYMFRSGIQIQDRRLRENLQMYVFNNKFVDSETGRIYDRTRPAERAMFYKQVFNWGSSHVTDDLVVNEEFPVLWKSLIVQAVRYIRDVQDSPNPDIYVSRQPIMQAVEDLQYNLSTHCTGMANVISPIIHKELKFIREKIFSHPEVLKQLVPAGGSWWKVVELLFTEMKRSKPETRRLSNKAKFGNAIIMSIAAYDPGTFEDNAAFSRFMSNIDALILTQAKGPREVEETDFDGDRASEDYDQNSNGNPYNNGYGGPGAQYQPAGAGSDGNEEWDF